MIMYIAVGGLFGLCIGYILTTLLQKDKIRRAHTEAKSLVEGAKRSAEETKRKADLDGKELLYRLRVEFEQSTRKEREELRQEEQKITQREENLERRLGFIEEKEQELGKRDRHLKAAADELRQKSIKLDALYEQEKEMLKKISTLTTEEARELLMRRLDAELQQEKAVYIKQQEDAMKEEADKKAKDMLSLAIKRCAVEHTTETTVSVVDLPNYEMKGRIIGREGRNIRAFEMSTGVDVIIDDTPDAVSISSFDPLRREVARISLEKLIADGRIHPARIEEIVDKAKKELEQRLIEEGKNLSFDLGIHNLHPELIKLIGRLKYRTSFGQNAYQHSKEVAFLMGILAGELALDEKLAKRIGLLHDLGKAVDQYVEGTHATIGADLARKYGEAPMVINAIEAHHEEAESKSIYAVLSIIADSISASRPGARRETFETYVKRLQDLEGIANSFATVDKSYAIQAGREIRVIAFPDKLDDAGCLLLARDLKKTIEEKMSYPGQIKVTVIRETRAVEYAK